jgi:hypothetical protein
MIIESFGTLPIYVLKLLFNMNEINVFNLFLDNILYKNVKLNIE